MGSQLPHLEAYLSQLPDGLASYPNHRQRAAVYYAFAEGIDLTPHLHHFPRRLVERITRPPPADDWMSEVEATAIYMAHIDLVFAGDEERFVAHAYERNRRLLDSPLYRVLFRLVGPERTTRGVASRWSGFHQGIALTASMTGARTLIARMEFPPGLVPPLIARCQATAFQAALELSGARAVRSIVVAEEPTSITIETTWA